MNVFIVFLGCCAVITCGAALNVSQCHDVVKPFDGLTERVKIGSCMKPPCRLRKNTVIDLEMKLTPDKDIGKLTNSVFAFIVGVPFPFPGVDQTDACDNIYKSDGVTKVGCPLKAKEDYIYKNGIDVLQIYPRIKTVVHWGLITPDGYLICFEVPARITN